VILFDARHIENEFSGLGRYTAALAYSVINVLDVDVKLVILIPKDKTNSLTQLIRNKVNMHPNVFCEDVSIPLYGLKHHLLTGFLDSFKKCELYIYPHFDVPISVRSKLLYIIHDTFVLDVDKYITKNVFIKKLYFWMTHNYHAFRSKSTGICVSQNTEKDIRKHLVKNDSDIHHVLSGLTRFNEMVDDMDLPSEYILYVGDRRPHKNLQKMISSFLLLKQDPSFGDLHFLIVGSNEEYGCNIQEQIDNNPYILSLTNVSDEELNSLYKNADALYFLTQYEGFGLPILEAWSWGIKIITSNVGASVEIAPKGSLLLNPFTSPELIASAMATYLKNNNPIQDIDNQLFSWDRTAKEVLRIGGYAK
jgi:glycosyltransferase involved in cell wall biosynthesis